MPIEDIPPRPWTPSYSVTKQGPGIPSENGNADADKLDKPTEEVVQTIAPTEVLSTNGHFEPQVFPTTSDGASVVGPK